jgi:hypothetical protein
MESGCREGIGQYVVEGLDFDVEKGETVSKDVIFD